MIISYWQAEDVNDHIVLASIRIGVCNYIFISRANIAYDTRDVGL